MTASKQEPKKTPFDDLVYASGRWEIYRQDAGMGEKDYCVLRNGDFFCRTEQEQLAMGIVMNALKCYGGPMTAKAIEQACADRLTPDRVATAISKMQDNVMVAVGPDKMVRLV